jgi:hypothetical protein
LIPDRFGSIFWIESASNGTVCVAGQASIGYGIVEKEVADAK